ncbi:hypothetical protein AB9P05_05360 [Roseivirga sp. BDSF3-8]|uniref:hypothetical protein n=1 Tax=Roseivirga sp. BDSF3-8 TaxID=3241598 RepID=UPI0035327092
MNALVRKLRPVKIDQLIYVVTAADNHPSPAVRFDKDTAKIRLVQDSKDKVSYRLFLDGNQVHRSNVFYATHFLKTIGKYGFPVIGDCHTDDSCRGMGIYPYMLVHIYKELLQSHKEVYILVSPENTPSIRGIEKAGFRKTHRVRTTRIGPLYVGKKVERF